MLLGFCLGKLYRPSVDSNYRKKLLIWSGLASIILFIVIRYTNLYGNPIPWSVQPSRLYTFLSFIDVTKYPPSLLYMCITIGPALIGLAFLENANNWLSKIIIVFGRVPFLYYILHFYLLHIICMILFLGRGHSLSEGLHPKGAPFNFVNAGEGYSLLIVYLIWIGVVTLLYPICKWFSIYKSNHKKWWLSYL